MMANIDHNQYLHNAEIIHSAQTVEDAISSVATALNLYYANESPMVLCVMTGAAVFAGQLLPKLTFSLEFDYVQASRYHGETASKNLVWVVKPKQTVSARKVLILDDILDEGVTLNAIVEACKVLGASEVKIAVLTEKQLNKEKPIKADFVGLDVPNRYVFGYGMDINGCWRNLPAIYARNNS
jgi:hypoxanthine phosphoribosyltransferase